MSKVTIFSGLSLITAMVMAFLGFYLGRNSFSEAIKMPLILSIPILIPFLIIWYLDIKHKQLITSLFYWGLLGAFIASITLHIGINGLMLIDIIQKGSFGPAQGYWFLFSILGGVKALIVGGILGGISYFIFTTLINKTANRVAEGI